MTRTRSGHGPTLAAARRLEPGVARAIRTAFVRARDRVSINALAQRLELARAHAIRFGTPAAPAAADVEAVLQALEPQPFDADLGPAGTAVRDATLDGGRVAARSLAAAVRR